MGESMNKEKEEEEEEMAMPMPMEPLKKKRKKSVSASVLKAREEALQNLPCSEMYEHSYMHRDLITHVLVSPHTQFLITASSDGHIKFWKKMAKNIEFVKHYKAHLQAITGLSVSSDGLRLCSTCSSDQHIKFYDVKGFDMIHMLKVPYPPALCCWAYPKGAILPKIVVSDAKQPTIRIYNADSVGVEPLYTINDLHMSPVSALCYNELDNCMISGDSKGSLEYWNLEDSSAYYEQLGIKYKMDTDLFDLMKSETFAMNISISPDCKYFATTSNDDQLRIFRFRNGKIRRKYDESLGIFVDAQEEDKLKLDNLDFGRRVAVEKDLKSGILANQSIDELNGNSWNCLFDETSQFIIFPTLLGIKVINVESNELVKVLGRVENTERFLHLALFQGIPTVDSQTQILNQKTSLVSTSHGTNVSMGVGSKDANAKKTDPIMFATAFKKKRFYCFSRREPMENETIEEESGDTGRDILNEKPDENEAEFGQESYQDDAIARCNRVVIHTTLGDIFVKLFRKECPKTIENFLTHAKNGYYDNVIFHRVIKNFMIQTGDPLGDGTGGESIWGGEFEDELNRDLRHDRPFTVSMANAGPNTNGSQFFITTVPTPWLDQKHTVFGRVHQGMDTVSSIEGVRADKFDKPYDEIKIVNIQLL